MKNYKEFEQVIIGESDIAVLALVGCRGEEGLVTELLYFGEDGIYRAYLVDEEAEIGKHYTLKATFNHWLKIYDDDELAFKVYAKEIRIYRAGDFGCVIQIIK
jgi:hypothetical protein